MQSPEIPEKFPIDKVDLCAGEVKVSREGLKELANIAFGRSYNRMSSDFRDIQDAVTSGRGADFSVQQKAVTLQSAARDFELAMRFKRAFDSLQSGERETLTLYPQRKL